MQLADEELESWNLLSSFQAWLFFGPLIEILGLYDIPVIQEDFVYRLGTQTSITTAYLEDHLAVCVLTAFSRDLMISSTKSAGATTLEG